MKITEDELSRLIHDFRAPARHVRQYAKIVQLEIGQYDNKGITEAVDRVVERALVLEAMVDGLASVGHIAVAQVNRTAVDVEQLLSATAANLGLTATIDGSLTVNFDEDLLKTTVTELLENVRKHGNSTAFEATFVEEDGSATKLVITNSIEQVFDKFRDSLTMPFTKPDKALTIDSLAVGLARARAAAVRGGGNLEVRYEDTPRFVATIEFPAQ